MDLKSVSVLVPRGCSAPDALDAVQAARPWRPFDPRAVALVAAISGVILKNPDFRTAPEMIAFAHQMRRRAVLDLSDGLRPSTVDGMLRGRGLAVHFAPANVDTIFLYSLLLSLLAGNANIVRLSSKVSPSVTRVVNLLADLLDHPEHAETRNRILLLQYEHNETVTSRLCEKADVRVIWGGDQAVRTIRRAPIATLSRDVVFPDRWSMAVFDARSYLAQADRDVVARAFANDVYWFGQMACSSPRLIVWRGEADDVAAAERDFYARLHAAAVRFVDDLAPIDMVNKRVFEDVAAVEFEARILDDADGLVSVSTVPVAELVSPSDHCGGGTFLSSRIDELSELAPLLHRKLQTVVSLGVTADDWAGVVEMGVGGVDRIVAPGHALNFASVWDGMDLLREFTRETTLAI